MIAAISRIEKHPEEEIVEFHTMVSLAKEYNRLHHIVLHQLDLWARQLVQQREDETRLIKHRFLINS
jgi:hypothetical protein